MATSHLTRMGRLCLLIALTTLLSSLGVQAQDCRAEFSAENQKNIGTADEDGTAFTLFLKNTSSSRSSFTLTATFKDDNCSTAHHPNLGNNVALDVRFLAQSSSQIPVQSVELSPGQSRSIVVDVQVPPGTALNRWSCISINAIDMNCGSVAAEFPLRVYVPDGRDD